MGPRWWPSQLGYLGLMMWSNLQGNKVLQKMFTFACVRYICLDLCHNMEITSWTSMMMCFVCISNLIFQWYIIIPIFPMRKLWVSRAVQSYQNRTDNVGFTSKFSDSKIHRFFSHVYSYILCILMLYTVMFKLNTWVPEFFTEI